MNKYELLTELRKNKINPRAYSIFEVTDPPHDEQYVLAKEKNMWVIYFDERGERTLEMYYLNEKEACQSFLEIILNDPTTIQGK